MATKLKEFFSKEKEAETVPGLNPGFFQFEGYPQYFLS